MPIILSEVDEYTVAIQAPADGDDRNGQSVADAAQGLANRTHNLNKRLSGFVDESHFWTEQQTFAADLRLAERIYYVDQFNALAPRARSSQIGVFSGRGAGVPGNTGSFSVLNLGPGSGELYTVRLPRGSTITRVRVAGYNNTGGTGTYSISLLRQAANFALGGVGAARQTIGTANAANVAAGANFLISLPAAETFDESSDYLIDVYGGPGCSLAGVDVAYLEHGVL